MNAKPTTSTVAQAETIEARIDAMKKAYVAAKGADKSKVRDQASANSAAALRAGNLTDAVAWLDAAELMKAENVQKVAAPIDWTGRTIDRAAALYRAIEMLVGGHRPAGLPDDTTLDGDRITWDAIKARAAAAGDAAADDATGAYEVQTAASEVASEKVGRSGVRNSIQDVLDRAFEGLPDGHFLTVAEVAERGAAGTYSPSDGAIAARVGWDKKGLPTTLKGVVPVPAQGTVARGFKKA